MRKIFFLLLAVFCIFSLSACSNSPVGGKGDAIHLKLSHPAAHNGPYDVMSHEFARLVEEKTNGRYVINIFAANALGSQEEMLEAATLGAIDLAVTSDDKCVNYVPEFGALGIPFLFEDVADVSENLNGEMGKYLSDKMENKGMIVISWFENGFRNVTSNSPVKTPDDLRGVKIRVSTVATNMALFENCGAVVTNVSFSELYTALQLGACDAQENPFANIVDRKFYEVQDYATVTKHVHTAEPLIMSKTTWDSLSPEDQAIFIECGREASHFAYQYAIDTEAKNIEFLRDKITIIEPDMAPWRAVGATVMDAYRDQYAEILSLKK